MSIHLPRAYFHAKAQRLVLVRLPVKDRVGADAGKMGLLKKSMYVTRDTASIGECDWQEHVKSWGFRLVAQLEELVPSRKASSCRHDTRRRLCAHGTDRTTGRIQDGRWKEGVYPIKATIISHGSPESMKAMNRRLHWGERGTVYQHDPRHVDVPVKKVGPER